MNTLQPIKLFVDAHVFDTEYQGSRTFIKELYSQLATREGLQLYMGAFDIDQLRTAFPFDNIQFIPYRHHSGLMRLTRDIPGIIREHGIGYAHFQYILPPARLCRYIATIHDVIFSEFPGEFSLPYRLMKKYLYNNTAKRSDILTTVSQYSKKSIERYLQPGNKPIHVIPNAVSSHYFDDYNKEEAIQHLHSKYGIRKSILYVSRFEPRKNHIGLLRAWLNLGLYKKGYHLVMLGHQSLRISAFQDLMNSLSPDILKYIFINDKIPDDELLQFYRAASVFVYPSKAEGFGICPLEAAALRIPVICSNSSAMEAFDFFGINHIDPNDHGLLEKRLEENLTHPPAAASLLAISRKIRDQYSWENSAEKFYQLLLQPEHKGSGINFSKHGQLSIPGR